MGTWMNWLVGLVVSITLLIAGPCWALYWYGDTVLPRTLEPTGRHYPDDVRTLYWKSEDGQGAIRIREMNPLTMMWITTRSLHRTNGIAAGGSGSGADLNVTRSVMWSILLQNARPLSNLRRHAAGFALTIRISREWTDAQIIDTSLDRAWLGRDVRGLDAAAKHYFGRPIEALETSEQLSLLVIARGGAASDPYCRAKRFAEGYDFLAERVGIDASNFDSIRRRMISRPCRS